MLRRRFTSKAVQDTEGQSINFDEISMNGYTIHTAMVDNAVSREVPVSPIFDMFGRNSVIKTDFIPSLNSYRLSVLDGKVYSHTEGKAITYGNLKTVIESYPGGECVDGIICASYTGDGLTFEPYIYNWKSLSTISKFIRALLLILIVTVVVYVVKDTGCKEFIFFAMLIVKANIESIITQML